MRHWLRLQLELRPAWMNALLLFCAYMTFIYVPWDLLAKPVATDVQVWLGVPLHGWAAKLTTPIHGAIYAAATYGFWRLRPWMWPWASVYAGYLALSSVVWSLREVGGFAGFGLAVASAAALGGLALALERARPLFQERALRLRERYGDWALVTGASSGIGAAFARALAREGLSVVLAARRRERLETLAAELEKSHAIATRVVPVDLSAPEGADTLADAVRDLEIGLLVNNAGFGYPGRLDKQELGRLRELLQVSCVAPLVLTARLLPGMRERGRGAVIFVGSVAGCQPLPLHAVYGASKGFEQLLGEALWAELLGSGVDVLVSQPGTTETEFQKVAGELPHRGRMPEEVVETTLEALGRQPSIITDWLNWLRCNAGMRLAPRSLLALAARRVAEARVRPEMR